MQVDVLARKAPVQRRDPERRQGTMGLGRKAPQACSAGIPEGIDSVIK